MDDLAVARWGREYGSLDHDTLHKTACHLRNEVRGGVAARDRVAGAGCRTHPAWSTGHLAPPARPRPTTAQLEQERKRSSSLAESLRVAKEQSLAAVSPKDGDGGGGAAPR
jgi:hypothetical protein